MPAPDLYHDNLSTDNLFRELQRSGMFERIVNERISDYSIHCAARNVDISGAAENAQALMGAATLFVVPAQIKRAHHAEFAVRWRGVTLKEYSFVIPCRRGLRGPNHNPRRPGVVQPHLPVYR